MAPLEQIRIEKAAADCGFELTPVKNADGGLVLRSTHFPEAVEVDVMDVGSYSLSFPAKLIGLAGQLHTVEVSSVGALYEYLQQVAATARNLPNRVADKFREKVFAMPKTTEAERLVVQRVGQNLFRDALIDYWQGRCAVTGLAVIPLLRASHVKPWAKCSSDDERLDVFNGLLLAPHLDALFDGGWISFTQHGTVLISELLSTNAREVLGISSSLKIQNLAESHKAYLKFHNEFVLKHKN